MTGEPSGAHHEKNNQADSSATSRGLMALIVAKAGPLRDALEALLSAIPRIQHTATVDSYARAYETLTRLRPALVVLTVNESVTDAVAMLRLIKADMPATQCLVLAQTVEEQRVLRSVGAGTVVLVGTPPADLSATIEDLLPP